MTAADVDAFPSSRPIAPRRLPRRAVIVALVALALAVAAAAGWLGVRSRVDLQLTGSSLMGFGAEPGLSVAEDPAPGAAVAVYVVHNDGPVPATITMSADKPGYTLAADFVRSGEEQPLNFAVEAAGARSVTLAPGESAGVRLVLGFGCAGTNTGVAYGPTAVALDVTAVGITRQVLIYLDPTPMIRSTVAIPSSC